MDGFIQIIQLFYLHFFHRYELVSFLLLFVPFVLLFELPLYLASWFGIFRHLTQETFNQPFSPPFLPSVSCIVTCYSEGDAVKRTIHSLLEQSYPGHIEIMAMVDGVQKNRQTYHALMACMPQAKRYANRSLVIVPKIQRGGRVSSMNAGLNRASGKIVMALDGDTSFDVQMVHHAARHFHNNHTIAVTGALRVRNSRQSLVTRLQHLEYLLTIHAGKLGFANLRVINNIPGAFGIFRKSFLQSIGGWNTGSAEDLDLTLRIKQYQQRHPEKQIIFEPGAVAHTDAPDTFRQFFQQRLRWDGDLGFIYFNRHHKGMAPALMGWRNFLFLLWYGLFFQIIMPFVIVLYILYMAMTLPVTSILVIMLLIYFFYLFLTALQYGLYLLLLSERVREDLAAAWVLPVFPLFQFATRLWSALALSNQFLNRAHLDSAMAPYWVLKKGKQ